MSLLHLTALVLMVGVFVYLVAVLFFPEWFS